jgi:phenylalanyl-tRNA synthetase beta chain
MLISYKWLGDYLNHNLTPTELADILTNTGLEVEGIEEYKSHKNIPVELLIGHVKSVEKHPDADKLTICGVDAGIGKQLQIICGAPNVKEGQKVVIAPIGTTLTTFKGDKIKLQKAKIRGVESEGMICAEDELGLSEDHSGIMILPDNAITGDTFSNYLNIYEDHSIEVNVTPNRGDAISHIGVARDVAAVIDSKLNYPDISAFKTNGTEKFEVVIENTDLCPRYSGIIIRNIKMGESPAWLQNKLKAIGQKPINIIVDIANFVMNETGHPLHAFDIDKLEGGKIIVKQVKAGAAFTTLDKTDVKLNGTEIMICDEVKPIAIGGVMGGFNSMISDQTTSIFIESAYFDPSSIRRTSKYHGIFTDASYRFERGADPNVCVSALKRAAMLVVEFSGGTITSEVFDVYPKTIAEKIIEIDFQYISDVLGNKIEPVKIKSVLRSLEYVVVDERSEGISVKVPTCRVDVTRPIDLVEEFIRIYSFNNISFTSSVKSSLPQEKYSSRERLIDHITSFLNGMGAFEMLSPSMISKHYLEMVGKPGGKPIHALNTTNVNLDTMRTNMVFPGLEAISYNQKRSLFNLKFYEFGKIYFKDDSETYTEIDKLGIWISGNKQDTNWYESESPADYYYLKSVVENILQFAAFTKLPKVKKIQNEVFSQAIEYAQQDKVIAKLGILNKKLAKQFDIKGEVYYAEFDMKPLVNNQHSTSAKFKAPAKFPSILRDLSLLIDKNITFADIKEKIVSLKLNVLKEVKLIDVYEGDKIDQSKRSYTIRMRYQDEEKTLSDVYADKHTSQIIKFLEEDLKVVIRK